jgi:histidyl-tRNA synthetase
MSKNNKVKPKRVKPQLLKGFRDYPPDVQAARDRIIDRMREAVALLGFQPLQTASLESADVLLGSHYNDESLAELFGFTGPDETDMALRYEFTLSLARFVASQPNLPLPFRRYQYGNVWRVDKPGPGRFREFMQFDLDIVGTRNMLADAEIIAAMVTTLEKLGIDRFEVRYSNRKIANGVIETCGVDASRGPDVLRVIDKLGRIGINGVIEELGGGRVDDSGARIPGLSLPAAQIDTLAGVLSGAAGEAARSLSWAAEQVGGSTIGSEGVSELRQVQSYLSRLLPDESASRARFDLTIVRGLGYYTGPVFETTLLDLPEFGSIFSGGRYDNLLDRFQSQSVPAVGTSVGIDRLLSALIELKAIDLGAAGSQVLVTTMDRDRIDDYLAMLAELRAAGIRAEIFSGDTKNLTRQVKYGDKVGIPIAVIAGSDEFQAGRVTVKNMAAGAEKAAATEDREEWLRAEGFQETIPRSELVAYVKACLGL